MYIEEEDDVESSRFWKSKFLAFLDQTQAIMYIKMICTYMYDVKPSSFAFRRLASLSVSASLSLRLPLLCCNQRVFSLSLSRLSIFLSIYLSIDV